MYIAGEAILDASGCRRTAEVHVQRGDVTRKYSLPDSDQEDFSIIDFSPDGSSLLISAERYDFDFRGVQITVLPISSGEMDWRDVGDILHWHDCDATVHPQGFGNDGSVIILARPSIQHGHSRPNCVPEEELYSVNLAKESVERLPPDAEIKRYGAREGGPCQTCKTDPDIVGACFTVHGRMAMYNGTPTYRIWRIGTDRILGVHDFIIPAEIETTLKWENAAFGDFYVCPFTNQTTDEMQLVCVESAKKLVYKEP